MRGNVWAVCFVSIFSSGVALSSPPPVPHVTVVARNPVEGLRILAAQEDVSFQVFLWRADDYLTKKFRGATFEEISTALQSGGAVRIEREDFYPPPGHQIVRYLVEENVIASSVGRRHSFVVELREYREAAVISIVPWILIEFEQDFETVAARQDYPKGTVLDRVFGLIDLKQRAEETPRLEWIEVTYGRIGFISTPDFGHGFSLAVELSNPTDHGRLEHQRVYYMAATGLEPPGRYSLLWEPFPTVHVARDILVPAFGNGLQDRDDASTFSSTGGNTSLRAVHESP